MSGTPDEPRALRASLSVLIADEMNRCSGCGVCVKECAFLELYGSPRDLSRAYDPEDPQKNRICFECSLCGLCSAVCPLELDPKALFLEMRREAVDRGFGSFPEHKGLLGYERTGMSRRFTWYGIPEGCTTVFFPGCALPGTRPAATLQVYERLKAALPSLGLVMDCCTKPSHDLGREQYFRRMFGEMVAWLESAGVSRVLVACPNCYKVFTEYAPQFRTETVYQLLAELPPSDARGPVDAALVTIHDPCVIRSSPAPQDAVRTLLSRTGRRIEEMPHTRTTALCCGEGGTVGALAPDLAGFWGGRRVAEAADRLVVTYCAGCANHLGKKLRVSHILDLICDTPKPSSGPITYFNRLRLKSRFKKTVPAVLSRERSAASGTGVLRRFLFLAALFALIVLLRASGMGQYLEPEKLRAWFAGFGLVAPLVYIGFYTVAPALMLPGLPISMAGATVFGPVLGVVYTIVGATMGACVAFLIARYGARGWVERQLVGQRWKKLDGETAQNGWKAVAFTRLIPLFPFNLLNFAFGVTKIPFLQYAVATFVFMLPGTIAFVTFSSSLLGLLKGKVSREFFIGILLIVAVSLLPKLAVRYKNRSPSAPRPRPPWSLQRSMKRKAAILGGLGLTSAVGYLLVMHYFWVLDAYLYTIEFNFLFIAHRLQDADLAGFVAYLRPMSAARAAGIALVWQALQSLAFPFSSLPGVVAFTSAFGTLPGLVYSGGASLVVAFLAVLSGRMFFGDLLPLYNRSQGLEPERPVSVWTGFCAALLAAVPGIPLLFCGVWSGVFRLPYIRACLVIVAGIAVRILVSWKAG